jgi:hypothetical protein
VGSSVPLHIPHILIESVSVQNLHHTFAIGFTRVPLAISHLNAKDCLDFQISWTAAWFSLFISSSSYSSQIIKRRIGRPTLSHSEALSTQRLLFKVHSLRFKLLYSGSPIQRTNVNNLCPYPHFARRAMARHRHCHLRYPIGLGYFDTFTLDTEV